MALEVALVLAVLLAASLGDGGAPPVRSVFLQNVQDLPLEKVSWPDLAAGDLNGDGLDDLVVGARGELISMLSNGAGSFELARGGVVLASKYTRVRPALGDFNGDGWLDAVATAGCLAIALGNGRGGFETSGCYPIGGDAREPLVIDFDADGNLDVVVPERGSSSAPRGLSFHRGDGQGGLTFWARISKKGGALGVTAADFNEDGLADFVAYRFTSAAQQYVESALYLSTSPGVLRAPVVLPFAYQAFAADMDGDGHQDLLVPDNGGYVLPGNGDGTFGPPGPSFGWIRGAARSPWAVGDFTRDGVVDLATYGYFDLGIVHGKGAGALGPVGPRLAIGYQPSSLAHGNFDRDGFTDFAIADKVNPTLTTLSGNADGVLGVPQYASHPDYYFRAQAVDAGDIDLDGLPDVVSVGVCYPGSCGPTGSFALGVSRGGLAAPVPFDAGASPSDGVLAQLIPDAHPELLVVDSGNDELLTLRMVNGAFTIAERTSVPPQSRHLAVGDLDRDGHLDVLVSTTWFSATVLLGSGGGAFTTGAQVSAPNSFFNPVLADLNHDGALDLLSGSNASSSVGVAVLLGDGEGGFGPARVHGSFPTPRSVAVGDLDGDGHADIVTGTPYDEDGIVHVLLGDGTGGFERERLIHLPHDAHTVLLADLNGDRHLDLATLARSENEVVVLPGRGDATFGPAQRSSAGPYPTRALLADLDVDGWLDLVVASDVASDLALLRNRSGAND